MSRIEVTGLRESQRILDNIIRKMDDSHHRILIEAGNRIVDEARSNLQNNTNIDSGDLLSSIKILFEDEDSIYVGSDMPYAGHIEFGRGPVFPKDPDGWLHWIDKSTGKDVFAKKAKATEPNPFLAPAVEKIKDEMPSIYAYEFETKVRLS